MEFVTLVLGYVMWPLLVLGVLGLLSLLPALGISVVDKIGPALAGYALGTAFPVLMSEEHLYAKLGTVTTKAGSGQITVELASPEKYRFLKVLVVFMVVVGVLVWLSTLFLAGRTVEPPYRLLVPLAGGIYFVGSGIFYVYVRYGVPGKI